MAWPLVPITAKRIHAPEEANMIDDRKALTRLVVVFGLAAVAYVIAGLAATQVRDHLLARAQTMHDMRHHIDAGGDVVAFTATLPADR
jgi:hypothetical protein